MADRTPYDSEYEHREAGGEGAREATLQLEAAIHRINNPLASMLLSLARLTDQLAQAADGDLACEVLRAAREARAEGARVASAVQALSNLVPTEAPSRFDARRVLGEVLKELEDQERGALTVEPRFAEGLVVFVRKARFALLFRSAAQLVIAVQREGHPDRQVELCVQARQTANQLEVLLRGAGRDDLARGRRIDSHERFDILRGMVQQLGGTLVVAEEELSLRLPTEAPVYDSEAEVELARRESVPPRGELRILVVDDDVSMHRALMRGLYELGVVQAVRSMVDAVDLLEGGARFDVLLVDLVMPEGTGLDLFDWLAKRDAKLRRRAVLMTGMSTTYADSHPDVVVVGKPFDLPALRELVYELATRA